MYFKNFPKTLYQVSEPGFREKAQYVSITDITRNVRFKREILDNITIYDYYIMGDGERIEITSEHLFGSPYYHWVLMLLNERFDYINDFALDAVAFDKYIENKYPADYLASQYGTTSQGLILDLTDQNGVSKEMSGLLRFSKTIGNTVTYEDIEARSMFYYDETLGMFIKRFMRTDGTYLDDKIYRIDYPKTGLWRTKIAYDKETSINEDKRKIRIISESVLQLVLKNFKDLM